MSPNVRCIHETGAIWSESLLRADVFNVRDRVSTLELLVLHVSSESLARIYERGWIFRNQLLKTGELREY